MTMTREGASAALLPDGRVLVVGGAQNDFLNSAEIYDPELDEWERIADLPETRYKPILVTLKNGKVLPAGGWGTVSALVYDPEKDSWAETASLPKKIFEAMGALLPDGRVLLAEGQTPKSEKATLFYQPQLQIRLPFSEAARLQVDRQDANR